jgi:uncharacterized protein YggE
MKKLWFTLITLLAVAFVTTGCTQGQIVSTPEQSHSLNVTGTGTVYIQPDIARVNIGVQTQSPDAGEAMVENTTNANAVRQALIAKGVDDADIQTSNFSIYQSINYAPGGNGDNETTFIVENTVSVVVRELGSLGEVLAAVVDQGANTIYGVTFDVENPRDAIEQARALAIADAQSQAEAIAEASGVKLGKISSLNINEGSSSPLTVEEAAVADGIGGSVPISTGTLTIMVYAYLTYDFSE